MGTDCRAGVLILHQRVTGGSLASDAGVLSEVAAVQEALDSLGVCHRVADAGSIEDVVCAVSGGVEPVVFNLVESFTEHAETAAGVPAVCESFGRECTGADSAALALTLDKVQTREALTAAGVRVPAAAVVGIGAAVSSNGLPPGPWIVKPAASDASEGIRAETSVVCEPGRRLAAAVEAVHAKLHQPALVEQLVGTREINVSLLENGGRVEVLPLAEIDFSAFPSSQPRVVDYAAKWEPESFAFRNTPRIIPAGLPPGLAEHIRELALAAWRSTGCRDYARVDFRLEDSGTVFALEVNANPDISPDAGFAAALDACSMPFVDFVGMVYRNALARFKSPDAKPTIRRADHGDRDLILKMVQATSNFRPDEMVVAEEVLDESIRRGAESGYVSLVAADRGRVVGWVCYGPAPCTLGTYDVYWIVVDSSVRRTGAGTALMGAAEAAIRAARGRLIVLDTSGSEAYIPTRSFYGRLGFLEAARISNFYSPGDDKVIFAKEL